MEGAGSRNNEARVENRGCFGCQELAQKPPGVHMMTLHSDFFFFFSRMRNESSVSEIIANSKLVRFHGLRKGAGGKIGGRGVF